MPHVDKSFDYPNQLCLKLNCGSISTRYEAKEVKKIKMISLAAQYIKLIG
jgi:hypothetical protein